MSCCCGPSITHVSVDDDTLSVEICDGRIIVVPLAWYPRLVDATPQQRAHWQLEADGNAIRWPDVEEWVKTEELLWSGPRTCDMKQRMQTAYAEGLNEQVEQDAPMQWLEESIHEFSTLDEDDEAYPTKALAWAEQTIRRLKR